MVAGAEFGPVKYPKANPMQENGSEPTARGPRHLAKSVKGMRTPPTVIPSAKSASTMIVLKIMLVVTLAAKYENGGMGLARFTCSHPRPRSDARPAAVPNSDAPITPNVP